MNSEQCVMVFDGVCNFCSASVRFILERDVEGSIAFVPMQSRLGRELLLQHDIDPSDPESFLLLKDGAAYFRSDGVLELAKSLGCWRWVRIVRFVPRVIRDGIYNMIARNRYRWLGRRDVCFVPTPAQRERFLDSADRVR